MIIEWPCHVRPLNYSNMDCNLHMDFGVSYKEKDIELWVYEDGELEFKLLNDSSEQSQ